MRYHPSLLILKGRAKRRRIRVRRGSANNAVRDQRIEHLEWEADQRQREGSRILSLHLLLGSTDYRVHDVAERYRLIDTRVDLNREEIAGIRSREVPGWTAKEKRMHWDLTNINNREIEGLQFRIEAIARDIAMIFAILRKLISAVVRGGKSNA